MKKLKSMLCLIVLLCFTSTMLVGCKKSKTLTEDMVSLSQIEYIYDGTEKKPDVSVIVDGNEIDTSLYTISYSDNINVGTASVTVTATGKKNKNKTISGSVTVYFSIKGAELGEISSMQSVVYNGENQKPTVSVENNVLGDDYSISWKYKEIGADDSTFVDLVNDEFINAGVYKLTVTGVGNYSGEKTATYTIEKANYDNVLSTREDYVYSTQKSDIILSKSVEGGLKYFYSTTENFNRGTEFDKDTKFDVGKYYFYVYIEASKNYYSYETKITSFEVSPFNISLVNVSFDKEAYDYTGNQITPVPIVTNNNIVLLNDVDFQLSYSNNIYVGENAVVTITGKGNYTGTKIANFTIKLSSKPCEKHTPSEPVIENIKKATLDADGSYDEVIRCEICGIEISREEKVISKVDRSSIIIDTSSVTYTGEEFKPNVSVADFEIDKDYVVSYKDNINAGIAEIKINFINNYYDIEITEHFVINKATVDEPKIQGSFTYNGKEQSALSVPEDALFTVSDENTQINAGIYHIIVSLKDPTNYMWSNKQNSEDLTLEFVISKLSILDSVVELSQYEYVYSGNPNNPTVSVVLDSNQLIMDKDYTISYKDNINAGEATVVIKGVNNYDGNLTKTFIIAKKRITQPKLVGTYTYNHNEQTAILSYESDDFVVSNNTAINAGKYKVVVSLVDKINFIWYENNNANDLELTFIIEQLDISLATITLEQTEYIYSGEECKPKVTIVLNGITLINEQDYDLAYIDNINKGTAWVVATGKNNFSGEIREMFVIGIRKIDEPSIVGTYVYNGEYQTAKLSSSSEFVVVSNSIQKNAGTYIITLTLTDKDNCVWYPSGKTDDITLEFVIEKQKVAQPRIEGTYIYNKTLQTPKIVNTIDSDKYDLTSVSAVNAGTYEVVVSLKDSDNYVWEETNSSDTLRLMFVIEKIKVEQPKIVGTYEYNGKVQTAVLSVEDLTLYSVSNRQQMSIGVYDVVVSLLDKVNYVWKTNGNSDDLVLKFEIVGTNLENVTITLSKTTYTYTASAIVPSVTITINGTTLIKDIDYTLTLKDNINVGTATVLVKGISNYYGEIKTEFLITPKEVTEPILKNITYTYNGKEQTIQFDNISDYFEIINNKQINAGTYTAKAILIDKNNYIWSSTKNVEDLTFEYKINKYFVTKPTQSTLSLTYTFNGKEQEMKFNDVSDFVTIVGNKQTNAGNYEVIISLNDKTNCAWQNDENDVDDLSFSFVISKLIVSNPVVNGEYYYTGEPQTVITDGDYYTVSNATNTDAGNYEATITLVDKNNMVWYSDKSSNDLILSYVIKKADISKAIFDWVSNYTYTGEPIEAKVENVKLNGKLLTFNVDYTISYSNNINIGIATIKIIGMGNYTNYIETTFNILEIYLTEDNMTISSTSATYTGEDVRPTIIVTYNGKTLAENIDYSLSWTYQGNPVENIIDSGEYILSLTGEGIYSSNLTLTFIVEKATYNGISVIKQDYSYGETSKVSLSGEVDGNITYYYKLENDDSWQYYFDEIVLSVGRYQIYATISETSNYNYFETNVVEFEVFKASRKNINISREDYDFGSPTEIVISGYEGTDYLTYYYEDGQSKENAVVFDKTTIFNAGKYYIYVVISENDEYMQYISDVSSFTVKKIDYPVEITLTRDNYIYGQTKTASKINGYDIDESHIKLFYNLSNSNENGTEYSDSDDLDTGIYYIYAVIESYGNYNALTTKTYEFVISKGEYSDITVIVSGVQYGNAVMPSLSKTDIQGDVIFAYSTENINYSGKNYISGSILNVGTYYMYAIISESKNYHAYVTETATKFTVEALKVKQPTITNKVYNGNNQPPLDENENYSISCGNTINAGNYDVVISLKDKINYVWEETLNSDDLNLTYVIEKAPISEVQATLSQENYEYDGSEKKPVVTIYFNLGLVNESEYNVEYKNNTSVGTALVIITAKDSSNFEGQIQLEFSIGKKNYQDISVTRANYSYKQSTQLVLNGIVEGNVLYFYNLEETDEGGTLFTSADILNAGTYYFYAIVEASENYNEYKTPVSVFKVYQADISEADIKLEYNEYLYSGLEITPKIVSISINGADVSSDEYSISYENNTKVGIAKVIIRANDNGNYTGSKTLTFTISNLDFTDATVSFKDGKDEFVYTGYSVKDSIELEVVLGGKSLVLGEDYTWDISSNSSVINVGTIEIEVKGIGNYSGTIYKYCKITPASIENAKPYYYNSQTTSYTCTYSGRNNYTSVLNYIRVTMDSPVLSSDDYEIIWRKDGVVMTELTEAGTYIGTVTAKENSNFVGEARTTLTVKINKYSITKASDVTIYPETTTADGTNLINKVSVYVEDYYLLENEKDYEIVWKNELGEVVTEIISEGTYTAEITIKDTGNYRCSFTNKTITKTLTVS